MSDCSAPCEKNPLPMFNHNKYIHSFSCHGLANLSPRKDCNIANSTIRLTATMIGIRVVVDGWKKNLVLSTQT